MAGKTTTPGILPLAAGILLFTVGWAVFAQAQTAEPASGLFSSRAVVLNARTGKVYAVDSTRGAVVVFESGQRNGTPLAVGAAPVAIAVNEATNRIYVANAGSDTVSVINGETNAVTASVRVGARPYAITANPASNKIFVSAAFGDTITVIDGARNSTTAAQIANADSITVDAKLSKVYLAGYEDQNLTLVDSSPKVAGKIAAGIHLWGTAVNEATHTLYVTRSGTAELVAIDELSGVMKTVPMGRIPSAVAVNTASNMVYVVNHGDDSVTVVDGAKNTVVATLQTGKRPQGIAVDPGRNLVYVANKLGDTVTVINGGTNRVLKTLKTGKNPYALAVSPNSGLVYVALEGPQAVEVIDPNAG
jgi:YVTN family beta-propeller protein